jgi:hypothetical protein
MENVCAEDVEVDDGETKAVGRPNALGSSVLLRLDDPVADVVDPDATEMTTVRTIHIIIIISCWQCIVAILEYAMRVVYFLRFLSPTVFS